MLTLLCIAAILLVLGGLIFYLVCRTGKKLPIAVYFACVFVSCLMMNWAGYSVKNGTAAPALFRFGAASGISLSMFSFKYDGSNSEALAAQNFLYSVAITVCYAGAVLWTVLAMLQFFFKGARNAFRVFRNARRISGKTWIITGSGIGAEILLDSIGAEDLSRTTLILDDTNEDLEKEYFERSLAVINTEADAKALARAGAFRAAEPVLIAVSDNDEKNLAVARLICEERRKRGENGFPLRAFIMYTSLDRTEHFSFAGVSGANIAFFNPHELCARRFLASWPITAFMPDDFFDTKRARIAGRRNINHIFIGFGPANRELLKKNIVINQLLGCDYHALVIDRAPEDNEAAFKNLARGLFGARQEKGKSYFPAPEEKFDIQFSAMNVLARSFYETVVAKIKNADYSEVIIALGNDKLSAETAMELRQQLYENDVDARKVSLFVRAKNRSSIIHDDVINSGADTEDSMRIHIFGFLDTIYSLESIVDEKTDTLARHIAGNYSGAGTKAASANWEKLSNHERESNRYAALSIKLKLNLLGFDLLFPDIESEDDNAGERKAGTAESQASLFAELGAAYGLVYSTDQREFRESESSPRTNLARLEHQRWNTYHLASGWIPMAKEDVSAESRKNPRKKTHACITTFEGLDELAALQASLSGDPSRKAQYDTMRYDFDQMDFLEENIKNTGCKIARRRSIPAYP